jgi:hypothetical protein
VIFFAGAATEVGALVVDDETATARAVLECELPHATVNTTNAPTTAFLSKRQRARTFTASKRNSEPAIEHLREAPPRTDCPIPSCLGEYGSASSPSINGWAELVEEEWNADEQTNADEQHHRKDDHARRHRFSVPQHLRRDQRRSAVLGLVSSAE